MNPLAKLQNNLNDLAAEFRLRTLSVRKGLDFSSNDYLGLAGSDILANAARKALDKGVPLGSGGSRLLRGNDPEHVQLENYAANLFGSEAALFFATGYSANTALLSTLPQRGDMIFYDELVHASSHEGMQLSRSPRQSISHNDISHFGDALVKWRREGATGTPWILVESLYSMDGDVAPLIDLQKLADDHGAMLVIDEAHATGVFGQKGRGLSAVFPHRDNVITLHTLGKALGCEGALLCGPAIMREFLINRGRAFIFSTAPSPLMAAVAYAALSHTVDADDLRAELNARIAHAQRVFSAMALAPSGSQIIPLVIGDNGKTMEMAAYLQAAGFDVRGIRPPTVPDGTSRLRISITLNISNADITSLAKCIGDII